MAENFRRTYVIFSFWLNIIRKAVSLVARFIDQSHVQRKLLRIVFENKETFKNELTSSFPFMTHIFTSFSLENQISRCCSDKSARLRLYTKFLEAEQKHIIICSRKSTVVWFVEHCGSSDSGNLWKGRVYVTFGGSAERAELLNSCLTTRTSMHISLLPCVHNENFRLL